MLSYFMRELISDDTIFLKATHLVGPEARRKQALLHSMHTPALRSSRSTRAACVHCGAAPLQAPQLSLALSLQGAGTDESCLIDILASRTNGEIFQMREAYYLRKEIYICTYVLRYKLYIFQITSKTFQFIYFKELSKTVTCEIWLTQDS